MVAAFVYFEGRGVFNKSIERYPIGYYGSEMINRAFAYIEQFQHYDVQNFVIPAIEMVDDSIINWLYGRLENYAAI